MKTKLHYLFMALALLALATLNAPLATAHAQGTAFTYQGRLNANGAVASGLYDFRFKLYYDSAGNTQAGTAVLTNGIPVTNGLFVTTIDFGAGVFTGSNYWLEVDVRTNGAGSYTALAPLQAVTPTPYAIFANTADNVLGTVSAAQIGGTVLNASLPVSPSFSGTVAATSFAGNGAYVTNVNATALNGLNATNFWQLGGNNVAAGQFIGSTDNQPVELWVNGGRALRLEPAGASAILGDGIPAGAPNVIGGSPVNAVAFGVVGAVIGGGGAANYGGFSYTNSIGAYSDFSTIGGGVLNTIQTNASISTIGGGYQNTIQTNASVSTIGGGSVNTIQPNASASTIGGGSVNTIQPNASDSTIGGGSGNTIQTNAYDSTIGGGYDNIIQNNSWDSTIAGGDTSTIWANSDHSTIGGGSGNTIQNNASRSTISGGYVNTIQSDNSYNSTIAGGYNNNIQNNSGDATIGGGIGNNIQNNSWDSTIAGGINNNIYVHDAFIGGGDSNTIQTNADHSAIGGGWLNTIGQNDYEGTIAGGYQNSLLNAAAYATIGGGQFNTNSGNAGTISGGQGNFVGGRWATVPGGENNQAKGNYSIACGYGATASAANTFVWADGAESSFVSGGLANTFSIRATGGVYFWTAANASGAGTAGAVLNAGATSWTALSDRNAKKNFQPVDTKGVLEKLAAIPIEQWNYKWEKDTDVPNIGPMAQDFKHTFFPGRDDKGISTLEFDGVALAAIQGLNQKLEETRAENAELKQNLAELKQLVQSLAEKK